MLEEKDTISPIIVELQEILAEHGDLPVVGRYGESAMLCTEKYSVTPNFPSSQCNLLDFWGLDLIQKINNYDACKYTFVDDKLTYSLPNVNSSLIRNNGVQLCIYNQSVIDFSTLQIFR